MNHQFIQLSDKHVINLANVTRFEFNAKKRQVIGSGEYQTIEGVYVHFNVPSITEGTGASEYQFFALETEEAEAIIEWSAANVVPRRPVSPPILRLSDTEFLNLNYVAAIEFDVAMPGSELNVVRVTIAAGHETDGFKNSQPLYWYFDQGSEQHDRLASYFIGSDTGETR